MIQEKFDVFNNSKIIINYRTPKVIKKWIIFLIIIFLMFTLIISIYKYPKYLTYQGIIKKGEGDYYVQTYVQIFASGLFNNSNEIVLDDLKYKYEILNISEDYYIDSKGVNTLRLDLKIPLHKKYLIENNIITYKLYLGHTTVFNEIKNKIERSWNY